MSAIRSYILIIVAVLGFVLMPVAADAAQLSCDNNGVSSGQLYPVGPNSGACEFTGLQHIFSQIVCDFVSVIDAVLGTLYCGIQYSMVNLLKAVLTFYVMVFGFQVLMGTTQLNAKEIITRLLKISFVYAFATQSAWGIGFIFQFFMSAISDMSQWVLEMVDPSIGVSGHDIMPLYSYLDSIVYTAITGPFTTANSKLLGFFEAVAVAWPPMITVALYWLWTTFKIMINALISFMLGVAALAFLIALSPIFLSFMLFQTTFHFFESWLRYMISFSLQIVVVFAVIAMWLAVMSMFVGFFNNLTNIIYVYQKVWVQSPQSYNPNDTFAICPVTISQGAFGPMAACPGGFDPTNNQADRDKLIPPSDIMTSIGTTTSGAANPLGNDFLYYIAYNLGTLILISYAFTVLLKNAQQIAKDLVGPEQSPLLSAGWGNVDFGMPGGMGQGLAGMRARNFGIAGAGLAVAALGGSAANSYASGVGQHLQTLRSRTTLQPLAATSSGGGSSGGSVPPPSPINTRTTGDTFAQTPDRNSGPFTVGDAFAAATSGATMAGAGASHAFVSARGGSPASETSSSASPSGPSSSSSSSNAFQGTTGHRNALNTPPAAAKSPAAPGAGGAKASHAAGGPASSGSSAGNFDAGVLRDGVEDATQSAMAAAKVTPMEATANFQLLITAANRAVERGSQLRPDIEALLQKNPASYEKDPAALAAFNDAVLSAIKTLNKPS